MPDVAFVAEAPTGLIALDDQADAATSRVQIAKTGRFEDPRYGKFSITRSDFARWIENFNTLSSPTTGRLGLPVDVDHSPEKQGKTQAVGWVKSLDTKGADGDTDTPGELWATVEWNTLGKELIASRQYAYLSPSYLHNYKDETGQQHGTALVGVGLTNRPFLTMATVSLMDDDTLPMAKMLDAADGDSDDEGAGAPDFDPDDGDWANQMLDISDPERQKHAVVVKKIGGETKHMFPIPPGDKVHATAALRLLPRSIKAGHITESEADAIRQRAHEVLGTPNDKQHSDDGAYSHRQMPDFTKIAEAVGLAADADEATILATLAERQAPAEGTVTLSQDQVTELVSDAAAGRQASERLDEMTFDTAFDKAVAAGKLPPSQKETIHTLYKADSEHALKLLDELPDGKISMTPKGVTGEVVDENVTTFARDFEDKGSVEPMPVDGNALRVHARAVQLEAEKSIDYTAAVQLAERELGVTL